MIDEKKLLQHLNDLAAQEAPFTEEQNRDEYDVIMECIKAVEEQPKADWIPCEVDMPKEEYETYWIAVEVEQNKPYYYCSAVWTSKDGFRTMDIEANGKVVAWQPIQPYKKEGAVAKL